MTGRTGGTSVFVKDLFLAMPVRRRCISLAKAQSVICKRIRVMLVPFPHVAIHIATPQTTRLLHFSCHIDRLLRFRSLFFAVPPPASLFETVQWSLSLSAGKVRVTGAVARDRALGAPSPPQCVCEPPTLGYPTRAPLTIKDLNGRSVLVESIRTLIDDIYDDAWKDSFAGRLLQRSTSAASSHAVMISLWCPSQIMCVDLALQPYVLMLECSCELFTAEIEPTVNRVTFRVSS